MTVTGILKYTKYKNGDVGIHIKNIRYTDSRLLNELAELEGGLITATIELERDTVKPWLRDRIMGMLRWFVDPKYGYCSYDTVEEAKHVMKRMYYEDTGKVVGSLSNTAQVKAIDFNDWLVGVCMRIGILYDAPYRLICDPNQLAIYSFLHHSCYVCGRNGDDLHHIDRIGIGGDRKQDDSQYRVVRLCREHHRQADNHDNETKWKFDKITITKGEIKNIYEGRNKYGTTSQNHGFNR